MPSELEALIEALENATGPDRELDERIMRAIWSNFKLLAPMRPYSSSIAAALTLVPDEWTAWEVCSRQRKTRFVAEVSRLPEGDAMEDSVWGRGTTPAIALCIAALRACAAMEQSEGVG